MRIHRNIPKAASIAVLLVVSCWPVPAASEARIGALVGLARYSYSGDAPDKAEYRTRTAWAAGTMLELGVYRGVRLSVQPSYIRKGTKIAYEVEGLDERADSIDVEADYLSIPVLFKVLTASERWFVSTGFEMAWLVGASRITSSGESDIKDELADFDLAVHFGAGWIRPFGPNELFVEVRYTQSVLNVISSSETIGGLYGLRLKNSGIMFCVGLSFKI